MQQIKPEEIRAILKKKIAEFEAAPQVESKGVVTVSADGIAHVRGLPEAMSFEMIEFPNQVFGLALNLEKEEIVAIVLDKHTAVKEGDWAKCTGRVMQVPVGVNLIGRVINALGQPLDGLGPIETKNFRPIEKIAPAVIERAPVNQPLQTGYKIVDALVPIGRGQRELIIGDRSTGKSSMVIDPILNQKGQNVICVYVAIGQKTSTIVEFTEKLRELGALDYTMVVSASASDPVSLQYLAPYSGCAMAEEFMYNGKDTLIVYDDLSMHAKAYRMISILLRRPPGREAYPGDVFYIHAKLLERAAKLSKALGGGSMTALPVIETQLGDVSSYIPTNVISITDGQIFLDNDLFNSGVRPAVDVGISVSRVGGAAQTPAMRKLSGRLRLDLAQYREKKSFTLFSEQVDEETRKQLVRGSVITEVLKQDKNMPMPVEEQIVVLFLAINGHLDEVALDKLQMLERDLLGFIRTNKKEILDAIRQKAFDLDPEIESSILSGYQEYQELYHG